MNNCKVFSGSMTKIEADYKKFLSDWGSTIKIVATNLCQDFNNVQSEHGTDNSFYFVVTYVPRYFDFKFSEENENEVKVTGVPNTFMGEQFGEKISSESKDGYEEMTMLKKWFRWFTGK